MDTTRSATIPLSITVLHGGRIFLHDRSNSMVMKIYMRLVSYPFQRYLNFSVAAWSDCKSQHLLLCSSITAILFWNVIKLQALIMCLCHARTPWYIARSAIVAFPCFGSPKTVLDLASVAWSVKKKFHSHDRRLSDGIGRMLELRNVACVLVRTRVCDRVYVICCWIVQIFYRFWGLIYMTEYRFRCY